MKNILKTISQIILVLGLFVGIVAPAFSQAATPFRVVQTPTLHLYTGISAVATSMRITPFPRDLDGVKLTMTDFGTSSTVTIDPKISNVEEIVSFTGIIDNGDNTATLTGLSRDLQSKYPYTGTGTGRTHGAGASVVFGNNPQVYGRLAAPENDLTITGIWLAPLPTQLNQIATVAYVNGTAFGGIGNASETATGTVEIATKSEVAAGTTNGSLGRLAIPASAASSTWSDAVTSANTVVVSGATGKIDSNYISTSTLDIYSFGDGSDGNVTISSPTTLTRNMYYNNLTISSTLTTDGYMIFVKGTLSGSGTITFGTPNAGSNASGLTGGAGGTASGNGMFKAVAGTVGGAGNAGPGAANAGGTPPVTGSSIGVAGTGGNVTAPNFKIGVLRNLTLMGADLSSSTLSVLPYKSSGGSQGGSGGGASAGSSGTLSNTGAGGGAGASGGIVYILAKTWAGTFTISAPGANGGNATNAVGTWNAALPGANGGNGGAGGVSAVIYGTKTWSGSYTLTGGTGGTGGTSSSGGSSGSTGTTGPTGTSYEINVNSLF